MGLELGDERVLPSDGWRNRDSADNEKGRARPEEIVQKVQPKQE